MNALKTADVLMRPPYRCCGVSTRREKDRHGKRTGYGDSHICDVCGWSYRKDGTRKQNNGRLKPTKVMA